MSPHLDAQRWQALQAGRDEVLLAHIEEGCETCDAFLESLPGLDGEVDRALLSLVPRPPSRDELAWARFRRRQHTTPRLTRWAAAAAAVLLVVLGGWATRRPPEQLNTGLKGSAHTQLELRAALKSAAGALTPVVDGARVPAGAALVFQVRSGLAGPARLYVQRGEAAPVELAQLGLVEGSQELELGEEGLLGFSLRGEHGPLKLWLVAAETPTTEAVALAAIQAGGGEDLAVAHLRVDVVQTEAP
jgi:hypothetical protein